MDKLTYIQKLKNHSLKFLHDFKPNVVFSEQQKKIFRTINGDQFGCKSQHARSFASAFVGCEFQTNFKDHINGAIVVTTENFLDYKKMIPICMINDDTGYKLDENTYGRDLPSRFNDTFRLATVEEIEQFYKSVTEDEEKFQQFADYMLNHSGIRNDD